MKSFKTLLVISSFLFGFTFQSAFAVTSSTVYTDSTDVVAMQLSAAFTSAGELKLTWDAPTESDLDFYELSRKNLYTETPSVVINSEAQTVATVDGKLGYLDSAPASGISYYQLCVYTILNTKACGNTVSVYGSKKLVLEPQVGPFTDTVGHWAENYVDKLRVSNVVQGANGLYSPNKNILRAEAVKLILLGFGMGGTSCHSDYFPDMGATDWFCDVVSKAKDLGYIEGDNGYLYPAREITRAEAVKIVLKVKGIAVPEITSDPFADVAFDSWYGKYVAKAKELNIVQGTGDNMFAPLRSITRAELAKVVVGAAGL